MVPSIDLKHLSRQAQEAIKQRDWPAACEAYKQALTLNADLPDVHYGLATVYYQLDDLANAGHHFKAVIRLDPQRASAYINLGAIYNVRGKYDSAVNALRKGIELDPERVEGYYNLGLVYRRMGQPDLAIQAYREALRLNPRMADCHLNLANIYLEKYEFPLAAHHYSQALALRPGWTKAQEGVARAQEMMREEDEPPSPPHTLVPEFSLNNQIDPVRHHVFLTALNQIASDAEDAAIRAEEILLQELGAGHQGPVDDLALHRSLVDRAGRLHEKVRGCSRGSARRPYGDANADCEAGRAGAAVSVVSFVNVFRVSTTPTRSVSEEIRLANASGWCVPESLKVKKRNPDLGGRIVNPAKLSSC